MTLRLIPDLVLTEAGWTSGRVVTLEGRRIASIERVDRPSSGDVTLAGKALVPGTVNAHCHTFQSLLRGLGDDLDFTGWRDRVLYPFSERLMSCRAVTDVWVHGRRVVESGRLVTVDQRELLARVRVLTQGWCAPQAVAGLGPGRPRRDDEPWSI